jgi:hypothetical protein
MKITKPAYFISLGALLISVPVIQKSPKHIYNSERFFEINYENLLNQKNTVRLSQLATEVKYIRLETNANCLIYNTAKYYFSGNFIFVRNRDHILKFSSEGRFIKKIGNPGRGPGEITSPIQNVSIIPEKKMIVIYDVVAHKLFFFDFDGNLLKTRNLPRFKYVNAMNDSRYIAISQGTAAEEYTHFLINESGDTVSAVRNYESWKTPDPNHVSSIGSLSFEPFYTFRNKYCFKSLYNDTVYTINANNIAPGYFINLGKYRLPEEKRIERLNPGEARLFVKNAADYCFTYVFEAGDRLFLTTNEWGGGYKVERFVINKRGFVANAENRYSGAFKGYIENDWDGGALFWPKGSVDDNTVFMPIYVADLKNILRFSSSSNSLKAMVRYPDKRAQLEKMASGLDISDNPVLMIVTLKSDF